MFKTKGMPRRGQRRYPVKGRRLLKGLKARVALLVFVLAQICSVVMLMSGGRVYADTAPTLTDYQESNWTDVTVNDVTPTVTWSSGNLIVVTGVSENGNATLATPTATGLTFSLVTSVNAADNADVYAIVWSATAGSSGSSAITSVGQGGSAARGIAAYVYSSSQGVGSTNTMDAQNAKTISLTRANSNSAVINIMGDWDAFDDTTVNPSPVGGTVTQASFITGQATFFAVDWGDQGTAGTTSYGITDHAGTVDMSGIVVEIRGQAAVLEQEGFRWRADDGDEDAATWLASQDSNISRPSETNTRLRMLLNTAGDASSSQYRLDR